MRLCRNCEFREVEKPAKGRTPLYCEYCRKADKSRHRGRAKRRLEMIVCVDTEGRNDAFGIMRMTTLSYAREDGTSDTFHGTPKDALAWLMEHCTGDHDGHRQTMHSFHFTYDQAVLLKDFNPERMELVHKAGAKSNNLLCRSDKCEHTDCGKIPYRDPAVIADVMTQGGEGDIIAWDPVTKLALAASPKRRFWVEYRPNGDRYEARKKLDIHDHGTAFTGGLEAVIDAWRPELDPASRETIAWGKEARKTGFDGATAEQIAAYSEAECLADARTVRKLLMMLRKTAGIPMTGVKLYGSGSIAAQAFKHYGAPKGDDCDQEHEDISRATYFGGAIETPVIGLIEAIVESVDINSAYPDKMRHLPCMRKGHGHWNTRKPGRRQLEGATVGNVLCEWDVSDVETALPPFAVRDLKGNVYRPLLSAEPTWVTLAEYVAAVERYGARIRHRRTLWWEQDCECPPPFAFIVELYEERQRVKARMDETEYGSEEYWELDARQMAIKLIINSCYGKLAQSRPTVGTYTNFHYASYITGATRAQLCRKTWEVEDAGGTVVYTHTDSTKAIGVRLEDGGKELGAWGLDKPVHGLGIFQPGLTVALTDGEKAASRGCNPAVFRKAALRWLEVNRAQLAQHPLSWPVLKVEGERMVTRKAAVRRGKPHLAGNFMPHTLNIGPSRNKRELRHAKPLPGHPYAWKVPPKYIVPDTAGPQHLQQVREAVDTLIQETSRETIQGLFS